MSCTECYTLYGKHKTYCPHYLPREETQIDLQTELLGGKKKKESTEYEVVLNGQCIKVVAHNAVVTEQGLKFTHKGILIAFFTNYDYFITKAEPENVPGDMLSTDNPVLLTMW